MNANFPTFAAWMSTLKAQRPTRASRRWARNIFFLVAAVTAAESWAQFRQPYAGLQRTTFVQLMRVTAFALALASLLYLVAIWARPAVSWERPGVARVLLALLGSLALLAIIGFALFTIVMPDIVC